MNPLAPIFHSYFRGLERAYGTYKVVGEFQPGEKRTGKAVSYRAAVTDELWDAHLDGRQSLGIVPIDEDGMCRWGAIDIDVYSGFDLAALETKVKTHPLPLIACATKSGGAHLYVFTTVPVSAKLIRQRLLMWARTLGYAHAEVFPKQENRVSSEDVGNWINMPYFEGEKTLRYAICNGKRLSAAAFLEYVQSRQITPEKLAELVSQEPTDLKGAPPCIKYLVQHGLPHGGSHNLLFCVGVYFRKRYPEAEEREITQLLVDFNRTYLGPNALTFRELRSRVVRSLFRKSYFYKCNDAPCKDVCDKTLCREAEYGCKSNEDLEVTICDLEAWGKEPTIYHLTVNDQRIRFEGSEILQQQTKFQTLCMDTVRYFPKPLKQEQWRQMVNELFANMIEVQVPEDTGLTGRLWHLVETYVTGHNVREYPEDLLTGNVYDNGEQFCFSLQSLVKFLDRERFPQAGSKGNMITQFLQSKGAVFQKLQIKSTQVGVWCLPKSAVNLLPIAPEVRVDKAAF